MEQAILVYVDIEGICIKVGQLWGRSRLGRESMSFEYDRTWLSHPKKKCSELLRFRFYSSKKNY